MTRGLLLTVAVAAGVVAGCAGEAAEGRPWVNSVELRGVTKVNQSDLKKKLAIVERSWNPLAPKHYLDPFVVDDDRARIEAFYRARGYYGARVTFAEVLPRRGGRSVDVRFTVREGLPIRINNLLLFGVDDIEEPARSRVRKLDIYRGDTFDDDLYVAQKENLTAQLKEFGHPWATVTGSVEVDRDKRLAEVRLTALPGPWTAFDGIEVRGTTQIDPRLVIPHLGVDPHEPFSLKALDTARGKAYGLGVFSSVRATYEAIPGQTDRVRLVLTVKESTLNELLLGAGLGLESMRSEARVQAIYERRNFLGGLRTLQLRIAGAWVAIPSVWDLHRSGPGLTAEAVLTQPRVGFLSQIQWTVGYDVGIDYAYQFEGPRTSIGIQRLLAHDRVSIALSYNFQLLTFFHTDPAILDDPAQAGRLFGYVDPYRLGWLQEDLSLDLRDTPVNTRKGIFLLGHAEEGGVYAGGAFTWEKFSGEARGYVPFGSRVVVAGRVEGGQIFSQGDLGSPITQRFFLGGPSSHRGFNYDRLSLQVPSGLPGAPPIPVGGDQMFLGQFEVRVNLVRLLGSWLSTALFVDAGDVAAPSCVAVGCTHGPVGASTSIDFSRLHWAVGGGLRYQTVIGTFRADLGVRLNRLAVAEPDGLLNPDPGQRFAFHLSIGEAF